MEKSEDKDLYYAVLLALLLVMLAFTGCAAKPASMGEAVPIPKPICTPIGFAEWECNRTIYGTVTPNPDTIVRLAGEKPNGDLTPIKTDEQGYVIPSPCYERMQGAMLMMDGFLTTAQEAQHAQTLPLESIHSWNSVLADCVTKR